jgi:type VI protein secretion system component VasF
MAHTPLKMTIPEAQRELEHAWASSYSPQRIAEALDSISHKSVGLRIYHLILRLSFRGIYFKQVGWRSWLKVIAQNRRTIVGLTTEAVRTYRNAKKRDPGGAMTAGTTG